MPLDPQQKLLINFRSFSGEIKETCDEVKIKSGPAGHFAAPRYQ
jgi:hypothetical protein